MHQQFSVMKDEGTRAKWPHEIFLINLVFNHIFVFAATLGVFSTFPYLPLVVPAISFSIIGYLIIKAKMVANGNDTWFVKSHWKIAARRNRIFMMLLSLTLIIFFSGVWISKVFHWNPIATKALIVGASLLPFMVVLLVLIILGNESVHLARIGKLPKRFVELNPDRQAVSAQSS